MAEEIEEKLTAELSRLLKLEEDNDSYDVVPYMSSLLSSDVDMLDDEETFSETVTDLLVIGMCSDAQRRPYLTKSYFLHR